jgi:predicted RNase H-like HicB family nuclease
MDIPVVIHKEDGTVYGVTVPDIPGCHSWGDTIDDAMKNAREAIHRHIETLLELEEKVNISSSSIEELSRNPDYAGGFWALVDVDLSKLDTKPERINISLPKFILNRIDSYVATRHETRSGFLARAALNTITKEAQH